MSQLAKELPIDLSQQLTMISIFQKFDPTGFHDRLCRWCQFTGFVFDTDWSTHEILTMLDDDRIVSLGATLRKALIKEISKLAKEKNNAT